MDSSAIWYADLVAWQAARQAELAGPESWQGMVGLYWIEAADNTLGSSPEAVVSLPGLPAFAGSLRSTADGWFWLAADGSAQALMTDRDGAPTRVSVDRYDFFLIERQGRVALRVRDRLWATVQPPKRFSYFPADPKWRIEADWRPLAEPMALEVPNVSGELQTVTVKHAATFDLAGQSVTLLPMSDNEKEVFFVFRDRTSGPQSYGAGRFLKAPAPVGERITLDFNRAFNPPCAFTPYAVCPLPPSENWLPFAVEAGEKKPEG